MKSNREWWESEGGFFGQKYMEGDNSLEGFIPGKKEDLIQRTKREIEGIITLAKLKEGSKVLDVPCGYGRHSIELKRRGFQVTGIDINEEHLTKARDEEEKIDFLKKDMRNIGKENYNKFDIVINMFYSFGFFKKEEDNKKVMKEFYNALKNNGKLLLHTDVSPEMFGQGKYRFGEERTLSNGKKLVIEETYNAHTRRIEGSWTLISKNKKEKLTPYSVRIYSKQEFESLAKESGFAKVTFYGSFKGNVFTSDSPELIMIAEK